jgi:OFA family oxalate/formate antiporter-like MFS transporter
MKNASATAVTPGTASDMLRWTQLIIGILCMVAVANLQYGWTLFVEPMNTRFQWGRPAIQVAFTLFILMETWLVPFEGWLIDKFGLRNLFLIAGVLTGLGWVIYAFAESLTMLYFGAVVGGIGGGIVYGGSVGNALKWFPDHRGLAAGLTAMGYGAGAAVTVIPISNMIKQSGYADAFFYFGIMQGLVIVVLAFVFRAPRQGETPTVHSPRVQQTVVDVGPLEMLKQPIFWLLYVMFAMMATGGLMATSQIASLAKDYKVADVPVEVLGWTLAALPLALALDRVLNGITRPFFGWVSDHIGRENTMFIAFTLEGIGIILLLLFAHIPVAFVVLSGLVFFAWGEIYSLFPSISGDLFGKQFATVNYGALYTAKGAGSLLALAGAVLVAKSGTWVTSFVIAASFDIIAGALAFFVLKRMRIRALAKAT